MPGTAIGDAVKWMDQLAQEMLPTGYSYDYLGESRQYVTEGNALYMTFLLALAIIFLVLAINLNHSEIRL
ncbi:efflux RND transporter permease subunit [Vibrio sp. PP-XX7]